MEVNKPAVAVQTAREKYKMLETGREPFLRRARRSAELTIPALVPPDGYDGTQDLYMPFQSIGARGVNNLAAKLLLALMPPGSSFFRMTMDDFVVEELRQKTGSDDARGAFEEALGKIERAVINRMEQVGVRMPLHEALKHLIVPGNVLLEVQDRGKVRMHPLTNYVVKRDPDGNVLEIIVKQTLTKSSLPERARAIVETKQAPEQPKVSGRESTVDIYTRITRSQKFWKVYQEVLDVTIEGTEGSYPLDKSPWVPLCFTRVEGDDYGRGFVEEYIGDLRSLESGSQSIIEGGAAAAKILLFVDETGQTSKQKVAEAASGDVIDGNAEDVSILQMEKFADFSVQKGVVDGIEKRLEQAFLLGTSVQRNAERVTAEEVRFIIAELETAFGGFYSVLAQELQLPLVKRIMHQMQREGALPSLPEDVVSPQIVTGLAALGRTADLQKLDALVAGVQQMVGQEPISEYLNTGELIKRRATALGIDSTGLVRSEEEVNQNKQQANLRQMLEKLGPDILKTIQGSQPAVQP
jgi:Autographiviridae portal protein